MAPLRERLAAEGADAFLVKHAANVRYLSGFTAGEDASLLITPDSAFILTDFRYYEQAEQQAPDWELFRLTSTLPAGFAELVRQIGVRRVAFESASITYALYEELARAEDVELLPVKGWVEDLRTVKTPREIACIRRAVEIADGALAALPSLIRPGMTERELAWELEVYIRTHGADDIAFPIIVAGGPNSAMPHAVPSDRPLVPGEPIVLDLGAKVEGYCSDATRTVCLGQPDDHFREVYAIVLAAQEAAKRGIHAGLLGKEADAFARQVIADARFGEAFGHGLGHGVGLEVHERPSAGQRSEDRLQPGSVITVEPGIYLPGWGGVRIEDLV
ncbi:MAG: aminopeptidase P family protein, partial [Anaerolineae bacterium]|nr:aminopeptidase P family protein [Anaerolineae bacterium]